MPTTKITIVGSGIAGLATAVSLHAAGFDRVTVYEADPSVRSLGLGLNILPNAVRELAELGLLDELLHQAVRTRELAMYNPHGDLVWREDRGTHAGYTWPQLSVSRSRLVAVLAGEARRRLGDGAVVTDARLVGLDHGPGGPRAVFTDRRGDTRTVETDVLLCADGIRSAARAQLYPDEGPPLTNGTTLYRGTAWADAFLTGDSMAVLGDDRRRLVLYPIERDAEERRALVNWVAAFPDEDGSTHRRPMGAADSREVILREFGRWSPPGTDLASLLKDTEDIQRYPMTDRDPVPRWTFGNVTLVGDAAHAMYPAGSNGATQAVIDARVLAWHLAAHHPDVGEALRAYEAERRPQMTELQASARSMGPERVITLAHQRAPDGFDDVRDVFGEEELAQISHDFAVTGRFDQEWVNTRPSLTVSPHRPPAARPDSRSTR